MFANLRQRSKNGECMGRTIESMILTRTQESSRRENRPSSSDQKEATTIEDGKCKTVESGILTRTHESSEDGPFAHQNEAKPIVIDGQEYIRSVAFLAEGKRVVSSGDKYIRSWWVGDGQEVGMLMDAGPVLDIAVSRDGKWIVSGTIDGLVTVWNAERHEKATEWKAHSNLVHAVDISPDGTKIATGSEDATLYVWSLSTGERLLDPLQHVQSVVAVRFSPNGRLIAIATWHYNVLVYDSQNGDLLVKFPVQVNAGLNQSLAWASDSKQLFALSGHGTVHCLDVSTRKTLSKWDIHSSDDPRCISLASNGTFITASANSSISFWDTATHEQIGSVIEHTHDVWSMAISSNYNLVTGGDNRITVRRLCDILPSRYFDNVRISA
jgi:WD40 repeat protein